MARGLERRALFTDDRERQHFLEILESAREAYGLLIHAYVLMGNHYRIHQRNQKPTMGRTQIAAGRRRAAAGHVGCPPVLGTDVEGDRCGGGRQGLCRRQCGHQALRAATQN